MSDHDDHVRRADEVRARVRAVEHDELLAAGPDARRVVDVRQPEEYAASHLPGAVNVPLDELADRADEVLGDRDAPVVTYCNGGNRGVLGADTLQQLGWTDVVNLSGGLRGVPAELREEGEEGEDG